MEIRCGWVNPDNELYMKYHDDEWGVPVHDDRKLFEMLVLEGAQAGLSWETILKKRENYRRAFANFEPEAVAAFGEDDVQRLLLDAGIIRNRLKIRSAIKNAKVFLSISAEFGSFDRYLWNFVGNESVDCAFATLAEIPTKDDTSEKISRDLKKRGMSFIGATIIYAFMQAVGMLNAHTTDCFRHAEIARGKETP